LFLLLLSIWMTLSRQNVSQNLWNRIEFLGKPLKQLKHEIFPRGINKCATQFKKHMIDISGQNSLNDNWFQFGAVQRKDWPRWRSFDVKQFLLTKVHVHSASITESKFPFECHTMKSSACNSKSIKDYFVDILALSVNSFGREGSERDPPKECFSVDNWLERVVPRLQNND